MDGFARYGTPGGAARRWSDWGAQGELVHTRNVQQYSARWMAAPLHEPFLEPAGPR